ncbi:MAG: hypothetical protein HY913_04395 [Desulfomonile tiedjei]|nr:hypothetical protein [Desulfomonile tiedjei]
MPIKIESEEALGTVGILSSADVQFISMVAHGANWRPYTSIKTETAGALDMAGQRVHAIILPLDNADAILNDLSGMDIEELRNLLGDAEFDGIKTEKAEKFETTIRYTQKDESDFKEQAFILKPIAETGAQVVLGEIKDKQDVPTIPTDTNLQDSAKIDTPDPITGVITEIQALKNEVLAKLNEISPRGGIDTMFESKDELKTFIVDTVNETLAKAEAEKPATVEVEKTETDLTDTITELAQKLGELESNLSQLTEKTEALAHTPSCAPSPDEDVAIKTDSKSKFGTLFSVKKAS